MADKIIYWSKEAKRKWVHLDLKLSPTVAAAALVWFFLWWSQVVRSGQWMLWFPRKVHQWSYRVNMEAVVLDNAMCYFCWLLQVCCSCMLPESRSVSRWWLWPFPSFKICRESPMHLCKMSVLIPTTLKRFRSFRTVTHTGTAVSTIPLQLHHLQHRYDVSEWVAKNWFYHDFPYTCTR